MTQEGEKMSDLISREALLKKYCKEPAKGDCEKCDWYGDSWCRCEIFGVQIADAPAVDAVEVKHGRWMPVPLDDQYEGFFKCSVCKTERYFWEGYPSYYNGTYCPYCGARMDGEDCED